MAKYVILRHRYLFPGNALKGINLFWVTFILIALHLAEAVMVAFKEKLNTQDDAFCYYIIAIECCFAAYAGFYLSDLFTDNNAGAQHIN